MPGRTKRIAKLFILCALFALGIIAVVQVQKYYSSKEVFHLAVVCNVKNENAKDAAESEPFAVNWWYCEADEQYYLFLPESFKNLQSSWDFNKYQDIKLDEKKIANGDTFDTADGSYTIKTDDGLSYTLVVMYSSSIPAVFMETKSGNMEYVHAVKGNEESARFSLIDTEGMVHYSTNFVTIKCRGNSTYTQADKKSYLVELADSVDLLEMGSAEKWLLISNVFDDTALRNKVSYDIAEQFQVPCTAQLAFVDLYLNGQYAGNYLFAEKVEVGENRIPITDLEAANKAANKGVDIRHLEGFSKEYGALSLIKGISQMEDPDDISGGYLIEIETDFRLIEDEISGFITSRQQPIVIKSPAYASENEVKYIADLYQKLEDAVFSEDGTNPDTGELYTDYIDMDSYVRRYILEELVKNADTIYTSQFFYKPVDDESTKLFAGPVWDYDKALGVEGMVADTYDLNDPGGLYASAFGDCNIYHGLYQHLDFQEYVKEVYQKEAPDIIKKALEKIEVWKELNKNSMMMNAYRWNVYPDYPDKTDKEANYEQSVEAIKSFLEQRSNYLLWEWGQ